MRKLLVGLAAHLGWSPCTCYEAVADSAAAQAQAEEELRLARADNARLRRMLAEPIPAPRVETPLARSQS